MIKKTKRDDQPVNDDGKTKKGFESTYQADKLRDCIKKGFSARMIMDKQNIKSKQVLKQHVLKLIQEDKEFYEISGLYEKGGRTIRATPKGELKIGPSVLKAQGIIVHPGDEFHLSVDGKSVILQKITEDNAPVRNSLESPLLDDSTDYSNEDETLHDDIED
jgi:hypothetical protein